MPAPDRLRRLTFGKIAQQFDKALRQWLAYARSLPFAQYLPDRSSNPRVSVGMAKITFFIINRADSTKIPRLKRGAPAEASAFKNIRFQILPSNTRISTTIRTTPSSPAGAGPHALL